MAENSGIEWTDHTFNPWRGCTKIAAGCTNCYAESMSHRNPKTLGIWGDKGTRVVASESMWRQPLKWAREARAQNETFQDAGWGGMWKVARPRVFCASLADVFEDRDDVRMARLRLWRTILATPELDWLLLTKRPENIDRFLSGVEWATAWPWLNVWLGTSVAERRDLVNIDVLRGIPAAVRFISMEPLLEHPGTLNLDGIDWVIVGCESGGNRRPFMHAWARDVRDQCREVGVAFFLKQIQMEPTRRVSKDMSEWADDLRVREWPSIPKHKPE